jgi:hypothetical protein
MSSESNAPEARRSALLRLVVGINGILFSETLAAEGAVVFAKACERSASKASCRSRRQVLSEREEP